MKFNEIIPAVENGLMIYRSTWPLETFVFRQVPSLIKAEIVPKMQSLPDAVKDEFKRRFEDPTFQIDSISYDNQLAKVNVSNHIEGWSPSIDDILADAWYIKEAPKV